MSVNQSRVKGNKNVWKVLLRYWRFSHESANVYIRAYFVSFTSHQKSRRVSKMKLDTIGKIFNQTTAEQLRKHFWESVLWAPASVCFELVALRLTWPGSSKISLHPWLRSASLAQLSGSTFRMHSIRWHRPKPSIVPNHKCTMATPHFCCTMIRFNTHSIIRAIQR